MNPRTFSKTAPLTDFTRNKGKYGDTSPAHIIQKARDEVTHSAKSTPVQHVSKAKVPKRENLTPVIAARNEKDEVNINRSQSASDSTREKLAITEFHAINAENKRRFTIDLDEELDKMDVLSKMPTLVIETSKSTHNEPTYQQNTNIKSPRKFIIKNKRTPSQESNNSSKRNSFENGLVKVSTPTQQASPIEQQTLTTLLVNANQAGKQLFQMEPKQGMTPGTCGTKKSENCSISSPYSSNNILEGESFVSIEENKSERSDSFSPLRIENKASNNGNNGEGALHLHDFKLPRQSVSDASALQKKSKYHPRKMESNDSNYSPLPITFSSITLGEAEIKIGDQIGEGAYGVVYKALNVETGKFIAVKHIKLANINVESSFHLENLSREIEVYQKLEHENIVRYLGYKQFGEHVFINMEYMPGGSVSAMLKQYGHFEEKVIKKFTLQVLQGLVYLHEKGVVHRDIKGGNILSDGSGNVKLADFGASKHIENISLANLTSSELCNSIKGSLYWMAPELFKREKHGRKIDIWSLGCTIIEMAIAYHPWPECRSYTELALAIMTKPCPPIPEHLSDTAQDFIQKCCQFDKKLRPRAQELLKHPFLTDIS